LRSGIVCPYDRCRRADKSKERLKASAGALAGKLTDDFSQPQGVMFPLDTASPANFLEILIRAVNKGCHSNLKYCMKSLITRFAAPRRKFWVRER